MRLLAAATLVAIVAVGAPMHAHDLAVEGGNALPQKAPCAACVVNASPGIILERADIAPIFVALAVVHSSERVVVALALPVRPGRAPPTV